MRQPQKENFGLRILKQNIRQLLCSCKSWFSYVESRKFLFSPTLDSSVVTVRVDEQTIASSVLFDASFYRKISGLHYCSRKMLAKHFLMIGIEAEMAPHPLFCGAYYRTQVPPFEGPAWIHYLYAPSATKASTYPLFDAEFYRQKYPDVVSSDLAALEHFLLFGRSEQRAPNAIFDVGFYLAFYHKRLGKAENHLVHYARETMRTCVRINPLFDENFYVEKYPEARVHLWGPVHHYLQYGIAQGLRPNAYFDPDDYIASISSNKPNRHDALAHYREIGVPAGRNPGRLFQVADYLAGRSDLKAKDSDPLAHYLLYERDCTWSPFKQTKTEDVYQRDKVKKFSKNERMGALNKEAVSNLTNVLLAAAAASHGIQRQSDADTLTIVIPVYKGFSATLRCILSALECRFLNRIRYHILVVDDASPDPDLVKVLLDLDRQECIELLVNSKNLGFVATVNRGMAHRPCADIILLNSDTQVFGDWADRLRYAIHSRPRVGTATPFSNNATICTYPDPSESTEESPLVELEVSWAELDEIASVVNAQHIISIPTCVGFCVYIQRACLDEVGNFDYDSFGRGYGEENDFCLRAKRLNWDSVVVTDTFVFHEGSVSFGADKNLLMQKNMVTLEKIYPEYSAQIKLFERVNPLLDARRRIDVGRLGRLLGKSKENVLFVSHSRGGGTERHIRDMIYWLTELGYQVLTIHSSTRMPGMVELDYGLLGPVSEFDNFHVQKDFSILTEILGTFKIKFMHVHHLVDFGDAGPDWARCLAQCLGIPYYVTAHDYASICPRINLIAVDGYYCGEPTREICEVCVRMKPEVESLNSVWQWRDAYARLYTDASAVFTPSVDTTKRIQRYFHKGIKWQTRPHAELSLSKHVATVSRLKKDSERLRVVVIGAIGPNKGARLLEKCAVDALQRNLLLEFIVVGYLDTMAASAHPRIDILGPYQDAELPALLMNQSYHMALFLSLWPETYSYTLSAAFTAQLFPVAFNFGAMAQRIETVGWGSLLPISMMGSARHVNDALLKIQIQTPPESLPERTFSALYPGGFSDYYSLPEQL